MTDTSGPTSARQFAFYDRDSSCWRTWPDISLWGSEMFSGAWPKSGMTHDGRAFELPTPALHIDGSGCSSLPTPTARDHKGRNQRDDATCLPGAVVLLPTPVASESQRSREDSEARIAKGRQVELSMVVALLPTPTATELGGTVEQYHERLRKVDGREPTFTPLNMLVQEFSGMSMSPPSDDGNGYSDDPHQSPPTSEGDSLPGLSNG